VTNTALVSGGKDSVYSAYLAESQGIAVDELLTLRPSDPESLLYHTPNLELVHLLAQAWGKRAREVPVEGRGEEAEGRALERALSGATGWVVAGAIASNYQWSRLHRVTYRLGRPLYTPLWGKSGSRVVAEEIAAGLEIRLSHLAAEPLGPELAGHRLDAQLLAELERKCARGPAFHVGGEGGEYESLVVDAPFLSARLAWESEEVRAGPASTTWRPLGVRLVPKAGRADPPAF
jgi:diphthine-ammonia ligase